VGRARPRAKNDGLPAPRKVRSRGPPPSYPREPTCPPPNRPCYDATAAIFLSRSCPRGKQRRAPTTRPRAETTAVVSALAQTGWVAQARVSARAHFARTQLPTRTGGKGGRGEPSRRLQKHGAVCADRLAKKRIARASGVFIGTAATFSLPIC